MASVITGIPIELFLKTREATDIWLALHTTLKSRVDEEPTLTESERKLYDLLTERMIQGLQKP